MINWGVVELMINVIFNFVEIKDLVIFVFEEGEMVMFIYVGCMKFEG